MTGLNSEILIWAREAAGLDLEAAAQKIGLKGARGVGGADRLAAFEAGKTAPSIALLRRMARQYHRPILTFYLPRVPAPDELGHDFRTLPDRGDPSNVLLGALLRDLKSRQALVREMVEDDEESTQVALVGACKGMQDSGRLATSLIKMIGFEREQYRGQLKSEDAFSYLRGLIESKGVFVILAGDCGSWQTAIEVSVFRGFAISDPLAPFIVVNDQDAKSAWSFTLLHELAHLLLGESGISGGAPNGRIEKLCNDAAAATLIERDEIADLDLSGGADDSVLIGALADRARVSRSMVAYQLFRIGRITQRRWEALRDEFRAHWLATKAAEKERNRAKASGPDWYVVRRHRLGPALLSIARQGMADGTLTPTRAARMLGVKPMSVYPLLADSSRRAKLA